MKHKLTRITALALAVIMSFSMLLVPVQAASFTDVPEKAWYKAAVDYVSEKGWMNGVGEMTFAPTMDVTRAMFVTLLAAYADEDVDNNSAAFTDTGAGKWYTGSAAWAAGLEIVKGIGDGRFAPNRAITRQDLCVMLYKYLRVSGIELKADADRTYADFAGVSAYAKEAVSFCAASGLVTGFEDETFRPKNTATRAQVAQILMRLDQLRQGQELPEDPMPAQSFEPVEAGEMTVSVEAPQGALPEGADMRVSPVTDEARLAAIRSKVIGKLYAAADISFSKDGEEIEPSAEVEVQIAMDGLDDIKNPSVVHVRDDGNVEYVEAELVSLDRAGNQKALRFRASRFSVYAVIGDDGSQGMQTITITFYVRKDGAVGPSASADDWEIINRQKVRKDQIQAGDAIFDPGVPNMTTTQSFEGWFYDNSNFTETDEGETIDDINAHAEAEIDNIGAEESWNFYAMVYEVVYIQYHDQNGAIVRTDYKHLNSRTGEASVMIDEDYVPFKSNQTFSGWVTADKVTAKGDNPTYNTVAPNEVYKVGTTYTVTGTLELYPYLQKGYWLSFNNNIAGNNTVNGFEDSTSAEYISPKFCAEGEALGSAPAFKSQTPRPGYTFGKWYVDPDMTNEFDFSQPLTKDTTVYAKWNPAKTSYRVLYWKQRASDELDAVDNVTDTETQTAKEFDYVGYRQEDNVTTGAVIGILGSDKTHSVAENNEDDFYFEFNTVKSDKTVAEGSAVRAKGDGTTVLNVYFNRKTITYRFGNGTETYVAVSSPDWSSGKTYYVKSGSSYLECFKTSAGYYYTEYTGTMYTNTTYYIIYNNSIYELSYNSRYNDFVFYDDGYYTWSGTIYTRSTSKPSGTIYEQRIVLQTATYTYSGLYGHQLPSSEWPSPGSGKVWSNYDEGVGSTYDYPLALTEYVPTWQNGATTLQMDFYSSDFSTDVITVYYMGQSLTSSSTYDVQLAKGTTSRGGSWYPTETEQGYTVYGYRFGTSGSWTQCNTDTKISVAEDETSNLYVAFKRNNYTLTFSSTTAAGTETATETLPYETTLSSYLSRTPTADYPGYYFAGWYLDEAGTKPVNLEKMPARNVIVYAKWNPKWYRVEVDYKRGNDCTVTVPGTTQKASFTVQYGSQVQTSALMKAKRVDADGNSNWLLVGLFLDEACTKPFNENMQAPFGLTEAQEVYPDSQRTGVDQLTNEEWSDLGYPDIRARITLYALWRADPEGTIGIDVTYLGDHSETDTGYFDVNQNPKPHVWRDLSQLYTDQAKAYAHAASIPDTQGEQFLYWEILNSEGESTGRKVYPGGTWTVNLADAVMVREKLPDPRCPHTNRTAVEALEPTCTEPGNHAYYVCDACGKKFQTNDPADLTEYDPTIPANGHTWGEWTVVTGHAPTCEADGQETRSCTVCQAKETRVAPALGHDVEGVPFTYVDGTGHWQVCKNDSSHHVNGAAHEMAEDSNQYVPPTDSTTGKRVYVCSVCGYTEEETLPVIHLVTLTYSTPAAVTAPAAVRVNSNSTVTLASVTAPSGYSFLGWVKNPVSVTIKEPTEIFEAGSGYTVEGDTTLYALFSREEAGTDSSFELVTTAPSDWTGRYVITYGSDTSMYVMKGMTGTASGTTIESTSNRSTYAASGITLSDNKLTNVADTYVFTLAKSGSYYSVKSVSAGTYLGQNSSSYYLAAYSSLNTTYCLWTPGFNTSNAGGLYNANSSSTYPTLSFDSSTNYYFWSGSSDAGNATLIRLWKETSNNTTYYSTDIGSYTVSFSVPSNVAAVNPVSCVIGDTVTLPAANDPEGYTFAGWVVDTVNESATAPETVYQANKSYQPKGNITLKALYSHLVGSSEKVYELLTAAPADWSGNYVITGRRGSTGGNHDAVMAGLASDATYESGTSSGGVAFANTGITFDSAKNQLQNVSAQYVFTVAPYGTGSYYTIKNSSTNTYLNASSGGSLYATSTLADNCRWTLSYASSAVSARNPTSSSYSYLAYLQSSTDSSAYFFGLYGSSVTSISFWAEKETGATYYTTVIDGATASWTVSFSTPEGVTAPAAMSAPQGDPITLPTADVPDSSYTFLGWVLNDVDNVAEQPANILTGSYTPANDVTLKALYSYTGNVAGGYKLSNTAPAAGETVILAGKSGDTYYALNHTPTTSSNATALTLNNGVVADTGSVLWTVVSGSNGIYLRKNTDSSNALKLNSSGFAYNGLNDGNGSNNTGAMSFAANGDGFDMYGTYNTGRHLGFSGTSFSVASSANVIYVFKEVSGTVGGTVYTTILPSGSTEPETCTLTYMANGSEYDSATVTKGSTINLPSGLPAVNGWTFAGWMANSLESTTEEPTLLTTYQVNGNATLYAVYTKSVGGSGTAWNLVSAANDVTAGEYVITWENQYYLPSETTATKNPPVGSGITVSNDTLTNTVSSAMQWTFTGNNTDGFAITHTNGSSTYYLGAANSSTGISVSNSAPTGSSYNIWRASDNSTYGMLLNSNNNDRYLAVNNNSTWRYYQTGQFYVGKLRLYKQTASGGTPTWTSTVPAEGGSTENPTRSRIPDSARGAGPDEPQAMTTESYYVEVTKPLPGETYLIGYPLSSTSIAVMSTSYYGSGRSPSAVNVTAASYQNGYQLSLSGTDLSDYYFTCDGNTTDGLTFRNSSVGYLCYNSGGYVVFNTSSSASYRRWSWSSSTGLMNKNWSTDDYDYFTYNTDGYFTASQTVNTGVRFYKLVTVETPEASDTVIYKEADTLTAGKQYVIVIDGLAASSTAFNTTSNRALSPVAVTVSGDTVTVPASSVESVLWYADGSASGGWSFLNLSTNKYMSLNESDVYWLAPLSTGWLWTYDGTDLDNNCTESDNLYSGTSYYRYLYVATNDSGQKQFSTTPTNGRNVKFYEQTVVETPVHKLTVHYVFANNGGQVREDYVTYVAEGEHYDAPIEGLTGYSFSPESISGTMESEDLEFTVTYTQTVTSNEKWKEVRTIDDTTKNYLIGIQVGSKVYLIVDYSNVNNASYYQGTTRYAYLGEAIFGTGADSDKIVGVTGAATDLQYCEWKFSSTTGGTVTGVYDGNTLYYTTYGGLYPYSSGDTFTFNGGSNRMTCGSTRYVYANQISGSYYAAVTSTASSAGTVRIYQQVVDDSTTWNVTLQDENGNAVNGFPSFQIEDGKTISFENEPSREDYYFLGWYQDGGDTEFDFDTPIHEDITLVAKFSYMWKVSYTITLRAVYGMRNETGDTHVYWYANDGTDAGHGEGAGDRYESEYLNAETSLMETHIPLNTGVGIPLPFDDKNTATVNWKGTKSETAGLYRPGYTFLGWARLEVEGTGVNGVPHPDLTETDLYLKWDAENQQYLYRPWVDGKTEINGHTYGENDWVPVTQFYADEGRPYHDMYAVWAPGNFYIYHSATGKLEAVSYLAVKNSTSGSINLTNHVTPGYLYGGYYLDDPDTTKQNRLSGYGYITAAEMSQIVKNYETGASANAWASLDHAQPDDALAVHVVANAEIANNNFRNYDGMARYVGGGFYPYTDKDGKIVRDSNNKLVLTEPIWNSAFAGTARGTRLEPEAGKVYYLKEVPSTYLSSKVLYTYDTTSATNEIQDVWIVTLVDDNNYRRVGFKTVDGQDADAIQEIRTLTAAETVAKSFTLRPKTPANGQALPATKVTAKNFGFSKDEAGYVAVTRRTDLVNGGQPDFTMLPGWVTFDGVQVCDNGMNWHYVEGADADKQLTWARTFNGTEKMYFNLNAVSGWTENAVPQKAYFFKGTGDNTVHAWADMQYIDNGIHYVTVPQGEWEYVILVRIDPGWNSGYNPNDESTFWTYKSKQTGDIPLNIENGVLSNHNYIVSFTEGSPVVTWGYYPAFPS